MRTGSTDHKDKNTDIDIDLSSRHCYIAYDIGLFDIMLEYVWRLFEDRCEIVTMHDYSILSGGSHAVRHRVVKVYQLRGWSPLKLGIANADCPVGIMSCLLHCCQVFIFNWDLDHFNWIGDNANERDSTPAGSETQASKSSKEFWNKFCNSLLADCRTLWQWNPATNYIIYRRPFPNTVYIHLTDDSKTKQ